MNNIKTVFFDIDDTLLNHSDTVKRTIKNLQKKYYSNVPFIKFQTVWLQATKKNWQLYEKKQLTYEEQGVWRVTDVWKIFEKLISKKGAYKIFSEYLLLYEMYWKPFPYVTNTLKRLRRDGLTIGIMSNGNKKQQLSKLKHLNIIQYFDKKIILISEEIGYVKPDFRMFAYAQNLAGVKPEEILIIGNDQINDIDPGKKMGWQVILVDHFNVLSGKEVLRSFKNLNLK